MKRLNASFKYLLCTITLLLCAVVGSATTYYLWKGTNNNPGDATYVSSAEQSGNETTWTISGLTVGTAVWYGIGTNSTSYTSMLGMMTSSSTVTGTACGSGSHLQHYGISGKDYYWANLVPNTDEVKITYNSSTKNIVINKAFGISATPAKFEYGDDVTLTIEGGTSPYSWAYSTDGGTTYTSLSATGDAITVKAGTAKTYKCTDANSKSATFTVAPEMDLDCDETNAHTLFEDDFGTLSINMNPTGTDRIIYCMIPSGWDEIYCYAYSGNTGHEYLGSWPGSKMVNDKCGYNYIALPASASDVVKFIFSNNGANQSDTKSIDWSLGLSETNTNVFKPDFSAENPTIIARKMRAENSYTKYTFIDGCGKIANGGEYAVVADPQWCGCHKKTGEHYGDQCKCGYYDDVNYWFRSDSFLDHTHNNVSYPDGTFGGMLILNCANGASTDDDILYERTATGLCANTYTRFSMWVANAATSGSKDPIKLKFKLLTESGTLIEEKELDGLNFDEGWQKVKIMFNSGSNTSVKVQVINKASAGVNGNDVLLDDMKFQACTPESFLYSNTETMQQDTVLLCPYDNGSKVESVTLSTVVNSTFTNPYYYWQKSDDGTTWNATSIQQGFGSSNSSYAATSGKCGYYRVIIAINAEEAQKVAEGTISGACGFYSITNSVHVECRDIEVYVTSGTICTQTDKAEYIVKVVNKLPYVVTDAKLSCQISAAGDYKNSHVDNLTPTLTSINAIKRSDLAWDVEYASLPAYKEGEAVQDTVIFAYRATPTTTATEVNSWFFMANAKGLTNPNQMSCPEKSKAVCNAGVASTCDEISLDLSATPTAVCKDEEITYTITLTNNNAVAAAAVDVKVTIPSGQDYVSCTGGTYDTASGLISVGSFTASEVKTITFKTKGSFASTGEFSAYITKDAATLKKVSVTVNALPTASISGANIINCTNPSITLTAVTDASSASYTWSNGGNQKTTSVSDAGDYYVTVKNTATGCQTKSAAHSVTKNVTEPTATVSGGTKIDCTVESVKLTASTNATNVSYLWSTGATGKEITVTDGGTYYVTVTNTDNGCSKQSSNTSVSKDVTKPTATITGGESVCQGSTLTLTGEGGDSYKWNDGDYGTTAIYSVPTGTSGTQTIRLKVKNSSNGCESEEGSKTVTVNAKPSISVTAPAKCSTDLTTYSVGVTVSDGTVSCDKSATIKNVGNVWTISGVTAGQNCTITVTTTAGCTNSVSVTAPDCECPAIAAPTNPQSKSYCAGSAKPSISVDTPAEGYEIHWYNAATGGTEVASGASFTPTTVGTYYAEMVQTVSGCKSSTRTAATLTENALPTASITAPITIVDCNNTSVTLTATTDATNATYTWSAGATGSGNTATVNAAGSYTVKVKNTDTGCENTSLATTITENKTKPTANITGDASVCQGGTLTLTGSGGDSYSWNGGAYSTTNTYDVNTTASGSQTITLKVKSSINGCESSETSKMVTVNAKPTIDVHTATECSADLKSYSFVVKVSEGVVTCDKGIVTNEGNIWTISGVAKGQDCTATVTTSAGCTNTLDVTAPKCECPAIAAPTNPQSKSYCAGSAKPSISVDTPAEGYEIHWYNAATGGTEVASGASFTPSATGTYYAETVQAVSGCKSSTRTAATLTENALPTASITAPITIVDCNNTSVTLTANTDATNASYTWSAGATGTGNTATVTAAGSYTVTVKNTDTGCENTSLATTITENKTKPTANIAGDASVCQGGTLTLTGSGGDIYSWNGGAYSTVNTYSVSTSATGTQTIKLKVKSASNGCESGEKQHSVTVNVLPTAKIEGDADVCQNGELQLTGSGADNFSWNNGAYTTTSTYDVNTTTSGEQNITLKVKDATTGCESSETSHKVTVNPLPTLTYKVVNPTTESEMTAPYILNCNIPKARVDLNGGATYKWDDEATDSQRTIDAAGTYSVYAISDKGCESASQSIEFTADKYKPVLQISSKDATGKENTLITCTNRELTLNAELKNPDKVNDVTYTWSTSETTQEIKVTSAGTYKVTAIAGSNGCESDENEITITQDINVPVVELEVPTDTLTCAASTQSVTLYAKASVAGCTFKWNTEDEGENLTVNAEGDYSVIATSTNGCQSAAADTTVVDKRQIPVITILKSAEKVTCTPDTLIATSEDKGMKYEWITDEYALPSIDGQSPFGFDDEELDYDPNAIHVVKKAGTYKVEGTNRYSCTGTAEITLEEDKTAPVVTIDADTTVITCSDPELEVEAKETSGLENVTYKWSDGKETAANKFTEKGTYTVTATNGATACTSEAKITVKENKQYPIVALKDLDAVCLPATVDISKAIVPDYSKYDTVKYYTDAAGTEELESPVVTVETKKIFYVQGFGVDGSGCVGQLIAPIAVVLKDVTSTPTVENYDECPVAEARSLKDQVTSDKSGLQFYESETSTTPRSDMFDASRQNTDATYYVTNTEYGKCESSRVAIEVSIDGTVDIDIEADAEKVRAAQEEVTVTAIPKSETEIKRYVWKKNATVMPDDDSSVTELLYCNTKFEVTAEGRCNSVTKSVAVDALWPTLITPKTGNNAHFAKGCDITVYNRYNEQVYHGTDGWDGTLDCNFAKKGEVASPGVYYYYITLPDGGTHKGTVEVIKF